MRALGLGVAPSSPTLRQRMDTHAASWFDLAPQMNQLLLSSRINGQSIPRSDAFAPEQSSVTKTSACRSRRAEKVTAKTGLKIRKPHTRTQVMRCIAVEVDIDGLFDEILRNYLENRVGNTDVRI